MSGKDHYQTDLSEREAKYRWERKDYAFFFFCGTAAKDLQHVIASWGSSSGATVDENRKNQFKSQLLQIFFVLINGSLSLGVCARLLGAALPDRAV